jgi:hypothetical protein
MSLAIEGKRPGRLVARLAEFLQGPKTDQHVRPSNRQDDKTRELVDLAVHRFRLGDDRQMYHREPATYGILPGGSRFIRVTTPSGMTLIARTGPTRHDGVEYPSSIEIIDAETHKPLATDFKDAYPLGQLIVKTTPVAGR